MPFSEKRTQQKEKVGTLVPGAKGWKAG